MRNQVGLHTVVDLCRMFASWITMRFRAFRCIVSVLGLWRIGWDRLQHYAS